MYILFLILFSYTILCNYYSISNMQYSTYETYFGLKIPITEIVLIVWRFSYICIILRPLVVEASSIIYRVIKDSINKNKSTIGKEVAKSDGNDTDNAILCSITLESVKRSEYFQIINPLLFRLQV